MGKVIKVLLFFLCVNTWTVSHASQFDKAIKIPLNSLYVTLEPYKLQDISSLLVSRQINCQLIRKYGREPMLEAASSLKYVSPLELSIKLQKNVKFSDDSLLTAEDVVATFDYLRKQGAEFRNVFDWIESIQPKGAWEVRIKLKKEIPDFITALSAPHYAIFKKTFLEQTTTNPQLWKKPIGCGGYRVYENNERQISLLPNGEGLPIVFTFEINAHISIENAQKYDLMPMYKIGNFEVIHNFHTIQIFDPYQFYFALNTRLPIWQNKKNRCAFFARIDSDSVMRAYDKRSKIADNLIPSGVLGYESNKDYLSKIKQKYSDVPLPEKKDFCVSAVAISIEKDYQSIYLNMLKKIYPNSKLKIINGCSNMNHMLERQNCDGSLFTYKSNYLDGYEFMQALSKKEGINPTGYYDPKLADSIKNSQMKSTPEEKAKAYRRLIKKIESLCLLYPLFTIPYDIIFVKNNLLTPGLGQEPINEYYLGNVSYKQ